MLKVIKNSNLVPVPIVNLTLEDSANPESTDPITARGAAQVVSDAVGTLIEDESEIGTDYNIVTDATGAAAYSVGKFYKMETKLIKCTSISNDGDTYTVEFEVLSGIAAALNDLVDRIDALSE